ncbi:MAG: hypothetical protein EHM81_13015 [Chloroflexi bacterium]|nr:MAG: hypothetical protein EHM81_13015 [Chloroflexota bacterium]
MTEKKRTYESVTLGLPPLKMVLGDIPEPEPGFGQQPFRPFGREKSDSEAKGTLNKLIGHLRKSEQESGIRD